MKLHFTHFAINGNSGAASAIIPGPTPADGRDRAAYFSIQVGFLVVPRDTPHQPESHSAAQIPGKPLNVHISYIWEKEVSGSDRSQAVQWPASGEYRIAFTRMLANMLMHVVADLQA